MAQACEVSIAKKRCFVNENQTKGQKCTDSFWLSYSGFSDFDEVSR